MANVVRLVNGGSIHVRTGVIQGIGPQGPRGVSGTQGIQGEQGPTGETGPMGQILQLQSKVEVNSSNPIAANTDTVLGFGSSPYDDLSIWQSLSNFVLEAAGDYLLSCWVRFDATPPKPVALWFATGSTIIGGTSAQTASNVPAYVNIAFPYRAAGGEVINVLARSEAATAVSLGSFVVTRVGSGPPGPQGPQGIQGPVGATGAAGPKGDPGSANSGFSTYADMLPH